MTATRALRQLTSVEFDGLTDLHDDIARLHGVEHAAEVLHRIAVVFHIDLDAEDVAVMGATVLG